MKLSIITINKNNAAGLEKTIKSVVEQTNKEFEYIVIDGASTDGSAEIIKKNSSAINYWISEPDTGIYNAINKGIRKAQGEYCLFLNSGDYLISSVTLQEMFNEINNISAADIFYSDAVLSNGKIVGYPETLTINHLINSAINHQNCLIKRSLFLEHGLYNEGLSITSDWEFLLKELWVHKSKFLHIKTSISIYDINGISTLQKSKLSAEIITMLHIVFNELSEIIIEHKEYHNTLYYNIIKNYGDTRLLKFILRTYRFLISRTSKLKRFINKFPRYNIFFAEMISSIFDNSIRINFTNFENISQKFFIIPIEKIFESEHRSYKIVKYYSPHIQFFSVFGNKKRLLHSKSKCKILFSGENNKIFHNGEYKDNCINDVSLSLGFDYLETKNYLRLPLWLLYFFNPDNSKDEIRQILNDFKKHYQKTKFCSLVASHDRSGIRTKIYNEISKISPIDCPSSFLHNDNTLHNQYADNKAVYLQLYKFNICPENSISHGYVTEKLFQSLYSGCIPIYNGWSKNPEPDIVNPNIILWYDENETASLNDEVKKLYLDDNYYRSFIEQPFFCDTAVDKIYAILQQFTEKMQYIAKEVLNNKVNIIRK
jgi:alpha(1,3/1,4) fucosyltransferase